MSQALVLASTSPRRRELVTLFNLPFRSIPVEVDETPLPGESPEGMVRRLAESKADSAVRQLSDSIVVAADTTVEIDNEILGKPVGDADAIRMLRLLRGRAHHVHSGIVVRTETRQIVQLAETIVWMRDYTDTEIEAYVATGDPLDKAAAYAIQHSTFQPVARIEGCYANVMGLPLCKVYIGLRDFGIQVPDYASVLASRFEKDCPSAKQLLDQ